MTALPRHEMTVDDFLAWAATQPKEGGKLELIDGIVMQQQAERLVHSEVKLDLGAALKDAIRRAALPCGALVDGPHVRVGPRKTYRRLIYCGPRQPPDVTEVDNPLVVFETLSPDSVDKDCGEKLPGYFGLPGLHHYLIVDTARRAIVHHRRASGDELATRVRRDGLLKLDPPGISFDVGEVFERV